MLVTPRRQEVVVTNGGRRRRVYSLRICDDCGERKLVQTTNPKSTHERCRKCHSKSRRKDVYGLGYDD